MAQVLAIYAVAGVLLVASVGPVVSEVRDASLADFEALDDPRPLNDFPFLEQVRPFLPPLVVEWLIVRQGAPLDLPPGIEYRVDDDGRVLIQFPDGCEETLESYRAGSTCAPPPQPVPCHEDPSCDPCVDDPANTTADECTPMPPVCPEGQEYIGGANGTTGSCQGPTECPPSDANGTADGIDACPPTPTPPQCEEFEAAAYDGTCVPTTTVKLRHLSFVTTEDNPPRQVGVELKVPYDNLSIELDGEGFPTAPQWEVRLFDATTGDEICWTSDGQAQPECQPQGGGQLQQIDRSLHNATEDDALQGNFTLQVTFTVSETSTAPWLEVRLYGKARDEATDA